ncbi:hypothetical protein SK128_028267 [Halocaridina rubra]|uniref:Uncharacterized protein n=1 Tax=Halocaridina rubra TaxID=373956 RepID=A0AAN8WS20_HALRR
MQVRCDPVPKNATVSCNSKEEPCLFHIPSDPCEYINVATKHPDIVATTKLLLEMHNNSAVAPGNKPFDPAANPKYWGYAWTNWLDYPQPHVDTL